MKPTKIKITVKQTGDTTADVKTSVKNATTITALHGLSGLVQSLMEHGIEADDIQTIVSEAIDKVENTQS